ncbi:hypothetical protein HYFRA_00011502 [Hymenoscyphus fraxineus]|uniref:Uncharacterized protein n=1 Tax=Hymenoscyphus fraxineus TaxID=746836 RepID=A0A9N9L1U7_9HELO|nr:hypothetical protein HYFRA_00011502 [Hymenoscyphus fraxineus]
MVAGAVSKKTKGLPCESAVIVNVVKEKEDRNRSTFHTRSVGGRTNNPYTAVSVDVSVQSSGHSTNDTGTGLG